MSRNRKFVKIVECDESDSQAVAIDRMYIHGHTIWTPTPVGFWHFDLVGRTAVISNIPGVVDYLERCRKELPG